jgi:hypothetical protein
VFVMMADGIDELEREIAAISAGLASRMAHWLRLIAEFDERRGARRSGFRSTSAWLAWRCGVSPRAARDHVRVARWLRSAPLIADAFADGRLSYSKVRALSKLEAVSDEAALLGLALGLTAAQLEHEIRARRSAPSSDLGVANRVRERRYLVHAWGDDGGLKVWGMLPPEEGAAFIDAIETAAEALHDVDAEGWRPSVPARRADALAEIVLSGSPPARVVLHVDPESLGETCHLEAGPSVPPETARRISCDGAVLDRYGRTRRVVSPSLRRSLELRDGCCRFPGCDRRHGLQAHHLRHWAHGGGTDPDNLVLLCRFHHYLVHEEGFAVSLVDGEVEVERPDGVVLAQVPPPVAHAPPLASAA